jgi:23S rRNA (guanosine2251-2'-O)-methyltransferase
VRAALANENRPPPKRLAATAEGARALADLKTGVRIEEMAPKDLASLLPAGAAHQGLAMRCAPPEPVSLDELGRPAEGVLILLDQITDPQNVGAIFRSAAAFGARGVILQDRNAPALSGAVAKAAAGAIDAIPHAREVNLSRALEKLDKLGWRAVALDGEAKTDLEAALDARPVVLVLGAEGEGVRRLVAEHCEMSAAIPMPGGFESLNVSNAAAVALYVASRVRG